MRSRRIAPALLLGWLVLVATGSMRRAGAEESAGDLDTLVAPIALYPDALLADILPASTYPVQVVEAARAVGHGGQVDPSQASQWDASVRALIAFPSVLAMMDDRIEWTTRLGQAVAEDQGAVLAAVQRVRSEAQSAGNLQSNDKQTVVEQDGSIAIQPTDPKVIYVPQYDPVAILSPPPPWGYYLPAYGVLGFGDGFAIDPLDVYGIGWGFGPAFFGSQIIFIDGHRHHHHDDRFGGHPNASAVHGYAWRPPPPESVGHPSGFRRPAEVGEGVAPGRGQVGSVASSRVGGDTASPQTGRGFTGRAVPPSGGAFDHVGGGGWNARTYSARGAHSFGDGFGGGGWHQIGASGLARGGAGAGNAAGFHGGGFGGAGHGGGGGRR